MRCCLQRRLALFVEPAIRRHKPGRQIGLRVEDAELPGRREQEIGDHRLHCSGLVESTLQETADLVAQLLLFGAEEAGGCELGHQLFGGLASASLP